MKYRKRNKEVDVNYILSNSTPKPNGCIEWNNAKNAAGYGVIRINHKNYLVHRFLYQLTHGKIDDNLLVCHECDNPPCANPEHLFLGTHKENTDDMLEKERESKSPRNTGENHGKSKLTEQDIINIRKLYRDGNTQIEISKIYSVSNMCISHIVNNKRWKHMSRS